MNIIEYLQKHNINFAFIKMKNKKPLCFSNNYPYNPTFKLSSVNAKFTQIHDQCKTQEEYIKLLNLSHNFPTDYIVYDTRQINCVDIDSKEYEIDFLKKRCSYILSLTKKLPHFFCYVNNIKKNLLCAGKIDILCGQGAYSMANATVILNEKNTIENIKYSECCDIANVTPKKFNKDIKNIKNNKKIYIKISHMVNILNSLNKTRFEIYNHWLIISSFIKSNLKNYEDQLMIFKIFSDYSDKHEMTMENSIDEFNKIPDSNPVPLEVILNWVKKDNPHLYDNLLVTLKLNNQIKTQYEKIKQEFEKKHFYILESSCYGHEIDKQKTIFKMNSQFKDDAMQFDYETTLKNGKTKEINFFNKWKKDKHKRQYRSLDWIPDENYNNPLIYNTFKGFRLNCDFDYYDEEGVELFINHVKLLTNNQDGSWQYLLKYIAHIFQYPSVLPEIAILIKSYIHGVGKDLLVDILSAILSEKYVCRTSDMKNITGNNNSSLKHKIIIQLNEVNSSDGYSQKDILKDIITRKTNVINEKYIKIQSYSNYARLIIFSNNVNPINISTSDRRFVVFQTKVKKSPSYYKKLIDLLSDENKLKSILFYLKNKVDLSNFDIRNRPKTSAYNRMTDYNTPLVYEFLFDKYQYTNSNIKINTSKLLQLYNNYIVQNNSKHTLSSRQLKAKLLMTDIIQYKRNSKMRFYEFDSNELILYLSKTYNLKKAIICKDDSNSDSESDSESDLQSDNISI